VDVKIHPVWLSGTVDAIPSKSQAHRMLICAALADKPTRIECKDNITIHRSDDGIIVIDPALLAPENGAMLSSDDTATANVDKNLVSLASSRNPVVSSPEEIWQKDETVSFGNFTMVDQAKMADGSVGYLTIPKISLSVSVFESENELEAMERGVAHFGHTSSWDGNIGLSAHNLTYSGNAQFFQNLHTLAVGDEVTYKTNLGTRTYTVSDVWEVPESDWSKLDRTNGNCVTMVTCITSKPSMRLVVRATEKTA
jgi:LPXTG-site transpeptidase (sortase) family protein